VHRVRGLAAAITAVAVTVAASAIAIIAVGVLVVAQSTFNRLMVEAGTPAAEAQAMFDHGVATTFVVAAVIAIVCSLALAAFLATLLARPLRSVSTAANRIAAGDYAARVPRSGPRELASLADSFNQMARSLAEQERARRDFIVNAAHELRTPLTNLQGYLEGLRDGVIAPTPEQFGSLHEEAQRLVRLSQSLDALADNDRRDGKLACEDLDLAQMVRNSLEVSRPAFEAKEIKVEVVAPERLVVRAEPDAVAQVLGNLLQNASRYTPPSGSVSVRAEHRGAYAMVTIANSGDGIPAEDLPHVFDRFYRVEKSRDVARGGAGIGLAIVKELVEAAGGTVGAESANSSTRFWVRLPAT
jgi:signal transduction histidine kinase